MDPNIAGSLVTESSIPMPTSEEMSNRSIIDERIKEEDFRKNPTKTVGKLGKIGHILFRTDDGYVITLRKYIPVSRITICTVNQAKISLSILPSWKSFHKHTEDTHRAYQSH